MEMSQDSVDISLHGVCVLDLYQCASDVDYDFDREGRDPHQSYQHLLSPIVDHLLCSATERSRA